jgi:uncharacterized RDD family membrane protein YckC
MLTGKAPYDTNTDSNFDILNKIVNEPLSLSLLPDRFIPVVKKATEKLPEKRFQSCDEFLNGINKKTIEILPIKDSEKGNVERNISFVEYANFSKRLGAFLLDYIFVMSLFYLTFTLTMITFNRYSIITMLSVLIFPLYFALGESSRKMATWGKRIVGVKVLKSNGTKMSFGIALIRYFSKILSTLILLVGWVMPLWTKKKQALHDMIANTIVVKS